MKGNLEKRDKLNFNIQFKTKVLEAVYLNS